MTKMIFRLAILAVAIAGAVNAAAAPTVRALFVGINNYQTRDDPSRNQDLDGAVNDVVLMRNALRDHEGLRLDAFAPAKSPDQGCASPDVKGADPVSPTLVNYCATRQNIITAWRGLVLASKPGDTLVFYYSGHGSNTGQTTYAVEGGQAMDTIVPTDARGPSGTGDLLGSQVKILIDGATSRGLNVVTIFDSCDSGAADRAVAHASPYRRVREIAAGAQPGADPDLQLPAVPPGTAPGYAVHLSSTDRYELAAEDRWEGQQDGDFTKGLVNAIAANPTASYDDLAVGAMAWLAQKKVTQHPQANGDVLATFLEAGANPGRIYPVRYDAGGAFTVRVGLDPQAAHVGRLGGVTSGSVFTLYSTAQDAVRDQNPIGQATVAPKATTFDATLTPGPLTPSQPAGRLLWAREINHNFGDTTLRLRIINGRLDPDTADKLKAMDLVDSQVSTADPADFVLDLADKDHPRLARADNHATAVDVAAMPGDAVGAKIVEAVRRIADYRGLANVAGESETPLAGLYLQSCATSDCTPTVYGRSAAKTYCVADPDSGLSAQALPDSQTGAKEGEAVIPAEAVFAILAGNLSCRDLHPYLFYLGKDYSITLLYPPAGAADTVKAGQAQAVRTGRASTPGASGAPESEKLVLIMSDTAIPAEALQQGGLPRGIGCGANGLARLLCAARSGTRDPSPSIAALGRWSAATVALRVGPANH